MLQPDLPFGDLPPPYLDYTVLHNPTPHVTALIIPLTTYRESNELRDAVLALGIMGISDGVYLDMRIPNFLKSNSSRRFFRVSIGPSSIVKLVRMVDSADEVLTGLREVADSYLLTTNVELV